MMKKPTTKKAPAKPDPWRAAYGATSEFTYEPHQALAILDAIPNKPLRLPSTIDDLTLRVRAVLNYVQHIQEKPLNKTARQQLVRLENQTNKLLHTLYELHSPTLNLVDRFLPGFPVSAFIDHTSTLLSAVRRAKAQRLLSKEAKGGHPRNVAMWRVTWELVYWWHAHVGMPTSYHDDVRGDYVGDFHHFAMTVITPRMGDRGLDAIIKRAVDTYRDDMERAEERGKKA
jgi:hypothetical protein